MVDYLREEYRHDLPPKVPGERSGSVASILSNSGPAGALGSEPPEELNHLDYFIWRRLWERYGTEPFPRGYLDQGRIKRLFGHQIIAVDDNYDPCSRDTRLRCLPYLSVPDVNGARHAQPVGMSPYEGIPRAGGIGRGNA